MPKKNKEYYIFDGNYSSFKKGDRARGLHLNKVVRDIMRECGYTCDHCCEEDCSGPKDNIISELLLRIQLLEAKCKGDDPGTTDPGPVEGMIDIYKQSDGSSSCPIDYAVTTFDLSSIGGGTADTFADVDALIASVEALTGITGWVFDEADCDLKNPDVSGDPDWTDAEILTDIPVDKLCEDCDSGVELITNAIDTHQLISFNDTNPEVPPNFMEGYIVPRPYTGNDLAGNVPVTVDWGDGNTDNSLTIGPAGISGPLVHQYAVPAGGAGTSGCYTVSFSFTSDSGLLFEQTAQICYVKTSEDDIAWGFATINAATTNTAVSPNCCFEPVYAPSFITGTWGPDAISALNATNVVTSSETTCFSGEDDPYEGSTTSLTSVDLADTDNGTGFSSTAEATVTQEFIAKCI